MRLKLCSFLLLFIIVSIFGTRASQVPEKESKLSVHDHGENTFEVEFHTTASLGIQFDAQLKVAAFPRGKNGAIGPAEKSGLIHLHDQLIAVNEDEIEGLPLQDVAQVLALAAAAPPPRVLRFKSSSPIQRSLSSAAKRSVGQELKELLTIRGSLGTTSDFEVMSASDFGSKFSCLHGQLVKSQPFHGCEEHTTNLRGKILFATRGHCSFVHKAINAQRSGALGIVIVNSDEDLFPMSQGESNMDSSLKIPSVLISNSDGQSIITALHRTHSTHIDSLLRIENVDCSISIGKKEAKVTTATVAKVEGMPGHDEQLLAEQIETCRKLKEASPIHSGVLCATTQETNLKLQSHIDQCDTAFDFLCWDDGCFIQDGEEVEPVTLNSWDLCLKKGTFGQYRGKHIVIADHFHANSKLPRQVDGKECTIDDVITIARDYYQADGIIVYAMGHRLWHMEGIDDEDDVEEEMNDVVKVGNQTDDCKPKFSVAMVTKSAGDWLVEHIRKAKFTFHHIEESKAQWEELRPLWHTEAWPLTNKGRSILLKRLNRVHGDQRKFHGHSKLALQSSCKWKFIMEAMEQATKV